MPTGNARAWPLGALMPLVAAALVLTGCPPPPPLGEAACRIETITSPPITKSDTVQQDTQCKSKYYELCDQAFTDAQNSCNSACENFRKRGTSAPTDPAVTGRQCAANPIGTTIPLFNEQTHCRDQGADDFAVSCTLVYTCTCDP